MLVALEVGTTPIWKIPPILTKTRNMPPTRILPFLSPSGRVVLKVEAWGREWRVGWENCTSLDLKKNLVGPGVCRGWNPTQRNMGNYFISQYKNPEKKTILVFHNSCHWWGFDHCWLVESFACCTASIFAKMATNTKKGAQFHGVFFGFVIKHDPFWGD